jgi:hypothetical protein
MQKDRLFAKIGELTIQFATLEHQWQELTETTFNEKKLTHLTRRLQGMSNDVQHLIYRLQHA